MAEFHVYLGVPVLFPGTAPSGSKGSSGVELFFDECNKELLLRYENNMAKRIETRASARGSTKYSVEMLLPGMTPGAPLQRLKMSADQHFLSFQASPSRVTFVSAGRSEAECCSFFVDCRKPSSTTILGHFWTHYDNLFFVTTRGVELYQFPTSSSLSAAAAIATSMAMGRSKLKLIKEKKNACRQYSYSHENRLLLMLGTGNHANVVQGFHFRPNYVVKLPSFELEPREDGSAVQAKSLVVRQIYARLFCIYLDSDRQSILLYQLTRDSVQLRVRIQLPVSGKFGCHVVDNLLLVHSLVGKVTLLYDIKANDPSIPVSPPLPMSMTPNAPASMAELPMTMYLDSWEFFQPNIVLDRQEGRFFRLGFNLSSVIRTMASDPVRKVDFLLRRAGSKSAILRIVHEAITEKQLSLDRIGAIFDLLNVILAHAIQTRQYDPSRQNAMYASSSETGAAVASVDSPPSRPRVRVGGDTPGPSPSSSARSLEPTTQLVSSSGGKDRLREGDDVTSADTVVVQPEESAQADAAAADRDDDADADSRPSNMSSPRRHSRARSPTIRSAEGYTIVDQFDIYAAVLVPLQDASDQLLFSAVLVDYLRSLNANRLAAQPFLYEMLVNYFVKTNQFHSLHQFLQYHVLSDSKHIACQLLSLEGRYPPAFQLALDMLKRVGSNSSNELIVEVLLAKGQVMSALRFLQAHPGLNIAPRLFLEAASACNDDNCVFFTVLRFFDDRRLLSKSDRKYIAQFRKTFSNPIFVSF